jgi:hypothetical protein
MVAEQQPITAEAKVEVVTEKVSDTLALVRALREEGTEVQVIIHHSEAQAPVERFETIEIGDAKWRQTIQLPYSMKLEDRNKAIEDKAVGAAQAFAKAAAAAKGA